MYSATVAPLGRHRYRNGRGQREMGSDARECSADTERTHTERCRRWQGERGDNAPARRIDRSGDHIRTAHPRKGKHRQRTDDQPADRRQQPLDHPPRTTADNTYTARQPTPKITPGTTTDGCIAARHLLHRMWFVLFRRTRACCALSRRFAVSTSYQRARHGFVTP